MWIKRQTTPGRGSRDAQDEHSQCNERFHHLPYLYCQRVDSTIPSALT